MIDSPARLLRPSLMFRVAKANRRQRPDARPSEKPTDPLTAITLLQ